MDDEDDENDGVLIKDKLEYCVPESVGINNEIKKSICMKCLLLLKKFFTFKRTCIRSSVTLNECCKKLPFANQPSKQLTLSLDTTNFQNTKAPLFLVKVSNTTMRGINESNKVVVPTDIKKIKKYGNKKCIKKFIGIVPPEKNKITLENVVQITGNTNLKRALLSTDVKNKIFQTTNTQTVGNSRKMRLLLPKDNIQKNNMTGMVGKILLNPCFLLADKDVQKNITYLQAVGNSVNTTVQNNRHLEIMQTVGINENDTVINNEIKSEVMESEDTENQDQRQNICEENASNYEIVKSKTQETENQDETQKICEENASNYEIVKSKTQETENQDEIQKICEENALNYEIVKSKTQDTENQDETQKICEENALNYEIVKSKTQETENQDGRQEISENVLSNKDILEKNKTTSEIDFEDLIEKNDIDIVKYKYLYVKGKYPSDKEFKHTYSLSEEQIQQNSTAYEINIKEDLPATDDNNQKCQSLTSNILKNNVDKTEMRKSSKMRYACFECNKIFLDVYNLRVHEKSHSGIKNHECKICKKKFFQKCNLDVHEKIHIGEKIYECSVCKKNFLRKSQLLSHLACHTEEKSYECSVCNMKFEKQINLLYHEKTHTIFNSA